MAHPIAKAAVPVVASPPFARLEAHVLLLGEQPGKRRNPVEVPNQLFGQPPDVGDVRCMPPVAGSLLVIRC